MIKYILLSIIALFSLNTWASTCSLDSAIKTTAERFNSMPFETSSIQIGAVVVGPSPYKASSEGESVIKVYYSYKWKQRNSSSQAELAVGSDAYSSTTCNLLDSGSSSVGPYSSKSSNTNTDDSDCNGYVDSGENTDDYDEYYWRCLAP
ncbi:MAG: hypothetical protein HOO06_03145 [Bdellovibrionaceae bacterium]|jgi:hypothetical protein|nr:hypothetical protein [Pseudobdellovibrionaceae bacterium]